MLSRQDILEYSAKPFLAQTYRIKFVTESWEREGARRLRQEVFCREQGLFAHHDTDAIDAHATTIVALSYSAGMLDEVVGTVRIHEEEPGIWFGSRLAVARAYRRAGVLGPALIRLAVTSAHAGGAHTFLAHVQSANAPLFERLHWGTLREELLHGRPHHFMQADLNHYRPWAHGHTGFLVPLQGAA